VALLCGAEASKSGRARPEASGGTFRGFFYLLAVRCSYPRIANLALQHLAPCGGPCSARLW
jgi:hypothetical protein